MKYAMTSTTFLRRFTFGRGLPAISRRWQVLLAMVLVLGLLVYTYISNRKPDVMSVLYMLRNRHYHQMFNLAPDLTGNLENISIVLYWTPFFQNVAYNGFGGKPFAHCLVNNCVATNDRRYLPRTRAVIFHAADTSMWDLPPERTPDQLFVYLTMEAPPLLDMPLGALNSAFNITMTYRRDSDVVMPYGLTRRLNGTAATPPTDASPARPAGAARAATVAWVVSHCRTSGGREQYVAELQRYLPVDVYGACNNRPCPERGVTACYRYLAPTHIFYLAFENALCHDYVTEKFFEALEAGMVPVVRGASRAEYEAVAPPGSFVHVDDFAGPRELAAHLRYLAANASALAELTAWRSRYRVTRVSAWCDLCALINRPTVSRYDDMRRWWHDGSQCSNGDASSTCGAC